MASTELKIEFTLTITKDGVTFVPCETARKMTDAEALSDVLCGLVRQTAIEAIGMHKNLKRADAVDKSEG